MIFRYFLVAALSFTLPMAVIDARAADPPAAGSGQLGATPEWQDAGEGLQYKVQRSADGRLFLTPNESFFPKLGLIAEGKGTVDDVEQLNGGNSYAQITGWDEGDATEWGLWLPQAGEVEVRVWMSGTLGGEKFALQLGNDQTGVSVKKSTGSAAVEVARETLKVSAGGRFSLLFQCEDNAGKAAALHWIELSGSAVAADGAAVLRKRWRPAAAHTKFSSAKAPDDIRLWVMEMDAVPGDLDFYAPITTPFGYYGPTWMADGRINTSFNFSLWSFARGAPEPPVEQLSHLLAIGNPQAEFSGFDHEGTGVKIRGWEPLEGRNGQRQALALRVEPGEVYDTYYSYFFATDEKRWRLFGVGNKWNKGKPLQSLWVGSFVEVPGPPPRQRTGAYTRRMRYRGWVMDESGRKYSLDQMQNGNVDKDSGLTHTDRGVTDDGWFYLETGGWVYREPTGDAVFTAPANRDIAEDVEYLDEDDWAYLQTVPSEISATRFERSRDGTMVRISFDVRGAGSKPEVFVHYGTDEGLTLAERWQKIPVTVPEVREGANQITLEGLDPEDDLKVRLLLRNEEGQFWTRETLE